MVKIKEYTIEVQMKIASSIIIIVVISVVHTYISDQTVPQQNNYRLFIWYCANIFIISYCYLNYCCLWWTPCFNPTVVHINCIYSCILVLCRQTSEAHWLTPADREQSVTELRASGWAEVENRDAIYKELQFKSFNQVCVCVCVIF